MKEKEKNNHQKIQISCFYTRKRWRSLTYEEEEEEGGVCGKKIRKEVFHFIISRLVGTRDLLSLSANRNFNLESFLNLNFSSCSHRRDARERTKKNYFLVSQPKLHILEKKHHARAQRTRQKVHLETKKKMKKKKKKKKTTKRNKRKYSSIKR